MEALSLGSNSSNPLFHMGVVGDDPSVVDKLEQSVAMTFAFQ
jgi:hypothetical protein